MVYTQVIESPLFLKLPLPNPPLAKGRELDFYCFPPLQGGIKGGNLICVYTIALQGGIKGGNLICVYTVAL